MIVTLEYIGYRYGCHSNTRYGRHGHSDTIDSQIIHIQYIYIISVFTFGVPNDAK